MTVDTLAIALAPAWRPNPGDTLVGAVAHRELRTTDYGTYPIVYIDADGTLTAVHAFHQTLLDGLKALKPGRGQFVSLTYVGKKESKDDKEYHHYVVVDPDASVDQTDINWDDVSF
jgi:hypothetical protein